MQAVDVLKLIDAANAEISRFLENTPMFSPSDNLTAATLSGLQEQVTALMLTVQNVGECVKAIPLASLDASGRAAIDLYALNLDRLNRFLKALGSYAEMRRNQIMAQSRKVSEVLAWCDAVKLASMD
jgi:hypothetical protein